MARSKETRHTKYNERQEMPKEEKRKGKSFAEISPQAQEREKSPVTLLKRKISKNPKVEKLLALADSVTISPKLDAELEEYFITSRDVATGKFQHRGVNSSFNNPRKNMEAIAGVLLDIQAYRDRLVKIQCTLFTHENTLKSAARVCEAVIREIYYDRIKIAGSLDLQKVFVGSILEPLVEKQDYITSLLSRVKATLGNLDSAHFTYKEVDQLGQSVIMRAEGGRFGNIKA